VPDGSVSDGSVPDGSVPDDPVLAARAALQRVYDPELGIDVVSLGLVYDVRMEGGTLVVEMTLTTIGCPASESLPGMARFAVKGAVGPLDVEVRLVWEPPWSPAMIDREAAEALGLRTG
jgi:metal-sulfur cluster biosynthetic enzyme